MDVMASGDVEDRVKVVWTPEAQQDRADILDYIAADNPQAAVRTGELFSEVADRVRRGSRRARHRSQV